MATPVTGASVRVQVNLPENLVVRSMTTEDKEEVAALFAKTFQREPLGAYAGVQISEGRWVAGQALKDPVSFVVEDKTLAGPNRLVAFRTSSILTKAKLEKEKSSEEEPPSPVSAILNRMSEIWELSTTVFETNPNAKVMKFIALGVDDAYEGLGLAKVLLNVSLDKARFTGCEAVVVIASAFATQHLFKNRYEFELKGQVRYADFTMKQGNEEVQPFVNLTEPEFLQVYEKRI
ncbi:hypothetical protein BGW38_007973 [Lunasporangiospora selenospora]|uniref:N-acetyltransferase domain-containing protein n=1 Tax=Lunasporangiospora selenospora TaxID=979761 RepID=A0A9P6G095_9FUNG|nr:hypothetical protein BGW38_007973 [Lunasporangiospora selenospora]